MSEAVKTDPMAAYQDAYAAMQNEVYSKVYFAKLAEAGIAPSDEDEARKLLLLAGAVRQKAATEQTKQANSRKSLIDDALTSLGVAEQTSNVDHAAIRNVATDCIKQSSVIRDAALLYGDYLAQVAAK